MPFGDIYYFELQGLTNGIFSRTGFHFKSRLPIGDASIVGMFLYGELVPQMTSRWAFNFFLTKIYVRNVSQPLLDEWSLIINDVVGTHGAFATDPRVTAYISLKGVGANSESFVGGIFWPGLPIDWAQEAPRLHAGGVVSLQSMADFLVATYGDPASSPGCRWGVFSRKNFGFFVSPEETYFRPVQFARVRPWLAHLRSRRPRGLL